MGDPPLDAWAACRLLNIPTGGGEFSVLGTTTIPIIKAAATAAPPTAVAHRVRRFLRER